MIPRCRWQKCPSAGGVSGGVQRKNVQEIPMGREREKSCPVLHLSSSVSGSGWKPNRINGGVLAAIRSLLALFVPSERRWWDSRWGTAKCPRWGTEKG